MEGFLWAEHPFRGGSNYKKCKFRPNKNSGERGRAMFRVLTARIFKGYPIIIPQIFWKDFYARNTRFAGVEITKNVKFDSIKILESAKGLCPGFLVHGYLEDLPLLSLKNFGGIPMGATPVPRRLKLQKI